MEVNISMLTGILKDRMDGGESKDFLREVPSLVRDFFDNSGSLECRWPRVAEHKEMFLDINQNGFKVPIKIYWDQFGIEIEGYHRLVCASALGHKTIPAVFSPKIDVLMVMAHPDDEIIFGWPIMQDTNIPKSLLVCSSDRDNPKRPGMHRRRDALEEVCKRAGITDVCCFDYPSEFYRLETRKGSLKRMIVAVKNYIESRASRFLPLVFTHNVSGEYGNIDHQLVNYICACAVPHIMYTNILQESNWMPKNELNSLQQKLFFRHPLMECSLNMDFYEEMESVYRENKCWTWSSLPVKKCKVFLE